MILWMVTYPGCLSILLAIPVSAQDVTPDPHESTSNPIAPSLPPGPHSDHREDQTEVLKVEYTKGEIDKDEIELKRDRLGNENL